MCPQENLFTSYDEERVFSMLKLTRQAPAYFQRLALWTAFAALPVFAACTDKKKVDRQVQIKAMLTAFFNVPANPQVPASGLWVADQQSLTNLIEKKYLASYVAKPDEKQATEIRERLKSLKMYFRLQGRSVQMLTVVADSFGASVGNLSPRPSGDPAVLAFDAVMQGKNGALNAAFRLRKSKDSEKLEYEEGGLVIVAHRESEKPDDLVARYMQQFNAATGLPQY